MIIREKARARRRNRAAILMEKGISRARVYTYAASFARWRRRRRLIYDRRCVAPIRGHIYTHTALHFCPLARAGLKRSDTRYFHAVVFLPGCYWIGCGNTDGEVVRARVRRGFLGFADSRRRIEWSV